jgi:hypothetical protein
MTHCPHCGKSLTPDPLEVGLIFRPDVWFDAFWQLYPRHVGKAAALKAWKKAALNLKVKDEIMDGFAKQVTSLILAGKFCPHASTWLNGRRWEDEQAGIAQVAPKRVIACSMCGDTGLVITGLAFSEAEVRYKRCSCNRGALPGLVIPQAEADDPAPF